MGEHKNGGTRPEALLIIFLIVSILTVVFSVALRERSERGEWNGRIIWGVQRFIGKLTYQVRDLFGTIKRLGEIRQQYEIALDKLSEYQGFERSVIELRRENEELKRQLGYSGSIEYSNTPARIIARDPSNLFSSITIDKGTSDGIKAGATVTAFQDGFFGLLGKIVRVGKKSSQVRPLIDPDHYVAGLLQKSRIQGLVEGLGNEDGELKMSYVHKSAVELINVNDLVVTSGFKSLYQRGIVIGRVKEIRSREYATSLELTISPVINVTRVEYVFVSKNVQ
ncbi:Rod shape-determining protein MreC [Olavius algarvensis spirochete endosymbiont]|uniref:rod shape-determining protein MreC n=1 Tax=Olavius algarvensis spirochete endosymbiont TaxID=260710 RepID=UPI00068B1F2E|nr:rod shape-determining protein MreC [Olavius algarvensis spirochete endosymbiont]VDB00333.1 Rod shape-determining protein MreC [Olavius algarvensis spirochete endosymbiont]